MTLFKRIFMIWALIVTGLPAMAQDSYLIRPGDTLAIEVLEDQNLNRSALVLPDGRFNFPFAGAIRARGRTVEQIQQAIAAGIAGNFNAPPNVFVSVTPGERPARTPTAPRPPATISVYFLGEVAAPGPKELEPGVRLLQALSTSGGFTNFAATKRVQLRRTNPRTGVQRVFEIDYEALANGAELRNDVALVDGDVILVPERRLFE